MVTDLPALLLRLTRLVEMRVSGSYGWMRGGWAAKRAERGRRLPSTVGDDEDDDEEEEGRDGLDDAWNTF